MLNKKKIIDFSVIIPVYKRKRLVRESIKSVMNQESISQEKIEIIVVDDEDDSEKAFSNKKLYKSFSPTVKYLRNKFEEGPGGARQTGLGIARGKFLTFLDSDDYLKSDFFSRMSKILREDQELVGAISFSDAVFEKGFSRKERIKLIPLMVIRDASLYLLYLFNNKIMFPSSFYLCQVSHMIFKRSLIKGLRFNYNYRRGGEDWDFVAKAMENGEIRIVPRKLIFFRYSPASLINKAINRKTKWMSYRKLMNKLPADFKSGIFYQLLLGYIYLFGGKYAKN